MEDGGRDRRVIRLFILNTFTAQTYFKKSVNFYSKINVERMVSAVLSPVG